MDPYTDPYLTPRCLSALLESRGQPGLEDDKGVLFREIVRILSKNAQRLSENYIRNRTRTRILPYGS